MNEKTARKGTSVHYFIDLRISDLQMFHHDKSVNKIRTGHMTLL